MDDRPTSAECAFPGQVQDLANALIPLYESETIRSKLRQARQVRLNRSMGTQQGCNRMFAVGPELGLLTVQIVRWVDDGFPGIVACDFVDAWKRAHTFVEKVPIVTTDDDLDATSVYPRGGGVRCTVLERWRESRAPELGELVRVYTGYPDSVETTEGLNEFVVPSSGLSGFRAAIGRRTRQVSGIGLTTSNTLS